MREQVRSQGDQRSRYPLNEPLVAWKVRKFCAQVSANVILVVGFEVSVTLLMKAAQAREVLLWGQEVNQDGHDFTGTHAQRAFSSFFTAG